MSFLACLSSEHSPFPAEACDGAAQTCRDSTKRYDQQGRETNPRVLCLVGWGDPLKQSLVAITRHALFHRILPLQCRTNQPANDSLTYPWRYALPEAVLVVEVEERLLLFQALSCHASLTNFVGTLHARDRGRQASADDARFWFLGSRVVCLPLFSRNLGLCGVTDIRTNL